MVVQEYKSQHKQLLAVDCIIFGYERGALKLLLFKREIEPEKGQWSLIGGWVNENETVEAAASRVLEKITSLDDIFMEQVRVYSSPTRDSGGRVVSVGFFALIRMTNERVVNAERKGAKWININNLPKLIFDHNEMVQDALSRLRQKATHEFIIKSLLPEKFTISQLRELYNALFQHEFDPGNFRKKLLTMNVITKLSERNFEESKKGAHYYKFKKEKINGFSERIVKI